MQQKKHSLMTWVATALAFLIMSGLLGAMLAGCGEAKDAEQKIQAQVKDKVYPLNADERRMAETNAKNYFEKNWPGPGGAPKTGMFTSCRPSDSNFNGLVSCFGFLPNQQTAVMVETKRYCGYRPDLVGCSDEDTVK